MWIRIQTTLCRNYFVFLWHQTYVEINGNSHQANIKIISSIVSCNGTEMNISFAWCDRTLRGYWYWANAKIFFDFYHYSIVNGVCATAMSMSLSLGLNKPFTWTGKFSHQIILYISGSKGPAGTRPISFIFIFYFYFHIHGKIWPKL